jgi:hypothetical protein
MQQVGRDCSTARLSAAKRRTVARAMGLNAALNSRGLRENRTGSRVGNKAYRSHDLTNPESPFLVRFLTDDLCASYESWRRGPRTTLRRPCVPPPLPKQGRPKRGRRSASVALDGGPGVQMARYYFHVRRGQVTVLDQEGLELASVPTSLPNRPALAPFCGVRARRMNACCYQGTLSLQCRASGFLFHCSVSPESIVGVGGVLLATSRQP